MVNSLIIHHFEIKRVIYPSNANQGSFMDLVLPHEPGSCAKVVFLLETKRLGKMQTMEGENTKKKRTLILFFLR